MMKQILIQFPGHEHGRLFGLSSRDSCLEPFVYLRNKLSELGYHLETADDHPVKSSSRIWFWDVPQTNQALSGLRSRLGILKRRLLRKEPILKQRDLLQDCIRAGMYDQLALFIGEPPVVLPRNWDTTRHDSFPMIFTWNDEYVDGKKYFKFHWPLTSWFPEVLQVPFKQKKLLANISGNKFSTHPEELYSARRETIKHFERYQPDQFDLYGAGWGNPGSGQRAYSSYRGTVKHKWDVYPYYRFGLCYENMRNVPGWITEKIFDCMRANCIPIYWGAPNITEFVDPDSFIDRTQFKSNAELESFLMSMGESDYNRYHQAIREYLMSDRFKAFLSPAFADAIIQTLRL